MNTCDTCKWWALKGTDKLFVCHQSCYHPKVSNGQFGIHDSLKIAVAEKTGEVMTGPKFGCIHHEPHIDAPPKLV